MSVNSGFHFSKELVGVQPICEIGVSFLGPLLSVKSVKSGFPF